jgi:low temperature requirement protein LtrA
MEPLATLRRMAQPERDAADPDRNGPVSVPATEWSTRTGSAARVSTFELFFDLVFVFIITQLTAVLAAHTTGRSLAQVLIMFGVTWWMYAGYAWLTNAVVPSNTIRRGLLIVGMAGFLTMALAVPHAFGDTGWAFGVGYFVVNLVHTGLFLLSAGPGIAHTMRSLGPLNLLSAATVLVGGFVPVPYRYVLWTLAVAVEVSTPYMSPLGELTVGTGHFVERHGLVVIVALGESVVAIGVGAGSQHLDLGLLAVVVSSLVVAYFLYWAYFGGDEVRAERAFDAIKDPTRRARVALYAFGYCHFPMLIGIVAFAAGVKKAIGHAYGHVNLAQALALGGGVALFLIGDLLFRRSLRIGWPGYRLIALAGSLASVPLGLAVAAGQVAVLMAVLAVPLSIEGYRQVKASGVERVLWRR